ncbi:aKG-HExxH-type peptide beta-hydroxylase [Microbispora sp. H13382]|uniref:aKG-HExxH-type peptide beta-hydroxylase n=1 Tax=Microbispora sp. H13382 TaxID=2729112 RepID=UPI001603F63D|nr:HEXXH motif-containing putative peptide modification protein [Microbispora sp. H13382]
MTLAYDLSDPLALLDGLPFLDEGFMTKRLMAAVAAARHVTAQAEGKADRITDQSIETWLGPSRALLLAGTRPMPAMPLAPRQKGQIAAALQELGSLIPSWSHLTSLPIRYALLHPANGAISASSRAWPQHILLSEEAFATPVELREQITHELSHQWLYLIEELWRLEVPSAQPVALPSGTANRSPSEVLGAAHVAAVLTRLYSVAGDAPEGRLERLADYRAGCLTLLDQIAEDLTDLGREIARHLKEAHE